MEENRTTTERAASAACPACGRSIPVGARLLVGETLRCDACDADLEVAEPSPPALIRRGRVEEDPGVLVDAREASRNQDV